MHKIGIPAVARHQDGVFTVEQAREAGWSARQIRRRQSSGEWVRVAGLGLAPSGLRSPAPGTPAAGPPPAGDGAGPPFPVRAMARAAQLTWPEAVACRRTAAVLHGFPVSPAASVEVATGRRRRSSLRMRAHPEAIAPEQVTEVRGLRVTDRHRTAVDCLAFLPLDEALDLYVWLWARRELPRRKIVEAIQSRHGRPGTAQLRRLLAITRYGAVSSPGHRLQRLLRSSGIAGWTAGAPVGGLADASAASEVTFPTARVVVTVRGPRPGTRQVPPVPALHGRSRYASLARAGYVILRVTPAELLDRPDDVVARIRHVLAVRGTTPRPVVTARVSGQRRYGGLVPFVGFAQERLRAPGRPASDETSAASTS